MEKEMRCLVLIGLLLVWSFTFGSSHTLAYSGEGQKALILKSGSEPPAMDAMSQVCIQFAEKMKQRTNGKIQITHYPDSQLGKWQQMLESIRTGAMAMMVSGALASKSFEATSLPYLFRDENHIMKVLDSEIKEDWAQKHSRKDRDLCIWLGLSRVSAKYLYKSPSTHPCRCEGNEVSGSADTDPFRDLAGHRCPTYPHCRRRALSCPKPRSRGWPREHIGQYHSS